MLTTPLGLAAASWAVVMAVSPILQIREMIRRRSSDGVSVAYLLVLLVGFGLWGAYGLASGNLPLLVPNALAFTVMSVTVALALRFR